MMIFAPLDGSASLVTSSSSRSVLPIPPSSMTLRNRNKGRSPVPNSSLPATNTTIGNNNDTVGDDQKDEASTSGSDQSSVEDGGQPSSSLISGPEEDETLIVKKKLPRVILRLGKPPDISG
jgi:histone deacetylase HOS3